MRVVELSQPVIGEREIAFAWSVTPESELYERTTFRLVFPPSVDLAAVPRWLWPRVALMCLHPHWALLGPCQVRLPVRLRAGEAEAWTRLVDAAAATLDARAGRERPARRVEIVEPGTAWSEPSQEPLAPLLRDPVRDGLVSCFSGGRDSITQAAMLCELGLAPTLVTVTSPVSWSNEHDTPRRRTVLAEVSSRRGLELVEVGSDLRSAWRNDFGARETGVHVNELTDALLFLAAAVAVAAARGAGAVLMASETEVQENSKPAGMVIQMPHFMYSAATHRALQALLAPSGLRIGSLTNSLHQFQVQRLLAERYPDLRDLQYSCWELAREQAACSRCGECRRIALNLLAAGSSPANAGIDLAELLRALEQWEPGGRYVRGAEGPPERPDQRVSHQHEMQELRCLVAISPQQVSAEIDRSRSPAERARAVATFVRLRERARSLRLDPEPGWRAGYLELLPSGLREPVRALIEQHFAPAPERQYAAMLRNSKLLSDWIAAPLARPRDADGGRAPARHGRPAPPALIPDPEPALEPGEGGRLLRVADTALEGNELRYLTECVRENWISSAGGFVPRFEREFAEAVGCSHGVACSSGTAALHLALAAVGIGPRDEVIVPAFTMVATVSACLYVGAEPVLVDADPITWNLDPERLIDKLSPRTRAIVAVHTYGQPAEMEEIGRFAARNGLLVIEDAAEAHGARHRGVPVGSLGAAAAFSFYGNKILTTGEGGILTTNDRRVAELARELRDHAFSRERHFWHRRVGFNYRMTNLQAAVGLAQTERLGELLARRAENARRYREALAGIPGIGLPPALAGGVSWMFGVTVGDELGVDRDELRRSLAARGVETRTFFVPLHLQPVHAARFAGQRYPVAEELSRRGLYLPSGPRLSAADIDYVAAAVRGSVRMAAAT